MVELDLRVFDNSPLQLSGLDLTRRSVILKTTNGTESILKARNAARTAVLSILNFHCTMDYAFEASKRRQLDMFFLCAGRWGEVSYDDVFVAGLGVRHLAERCDHVELSDTALLALKAASSEKDIYEALTKSRSGSHALTLGLEEDIRFSSRFDAYQTIGALEVDAGRDRGSPVFSIKPPRS